MTSCTHKNLVLLPERKERLRCRHCHLTIKADDLEDGCCPECLESTGQRRHDFETITEDGPKPICYRCEDCGLRISCSESAKEVNG